MLTCTCRAQERHDGDTKVRDIVKSMGVNTKSTKYEMQ